MDEQVEDNVSIGACDNYMILKQFNHIANLVTTEEFLETVPKLKGVKWHQVFHCLKKDILNEMEQEMNSMWEFENMPGKLEILERQKQKYAEINPNKTVWRPQHNVKGQLKAYDVAILRKQKALLISMAEENESKATRLKKIVANKRGFLKALRMDIQKYHKKNEVNISKIHDKMKNHDKLVQYMLPDKMDLDDINQLSDSGVDE